ncbi:hypothetical protein BT67DRAFT_433555 [Trichocladium antarcticum]|uniref:Uncharacterized protein n=1 Tax=Trichocladium antarcticum TaxID=1450529 RepID=A0AAN6ULX6_9PEZI|nr:hypothetical protein BT67DRAFT_433555 [Trichocladium antarcticum]
MPAQGRPAAPPSLPPFSDEATIPFSDLFTNGFDRSTIDATAQLADRSIFVASNGRRYRIESIPDPEPVPFSVPDPAPVSFPFQGRASAPSPAPAQPSYRQPPRAPGPTSPTGFGRAAPPPTPQLYPPDTGPGWRQSPSDASSHSYSPGGYPARSSSGPAPAAVRCADPNVSTHELTATMTHLGINGFGASHFYGESDGGAHTATALTDPVQGPRSPIAIPNRLAAAASCRRPSYIQHQHQHQHQHQQPPYNPNPQSPPRATYEHVGGAGSAPAPYSWTPVNYAAYTAQSYAHLQRSRQVARTATGTLPSILDGATAVVHPPPQHRAADPVASSYSSATIPDDKEVWDGQTMGNGNGNGGGSAGGYHPYPPLHASVSLSAPSSVGGRHPSFVNNNNNNNNNNPNTGGGAGFDTLTPVVVHHPHPPPPSTMSDGASTGRDNVLPGEDLLFDGPVKSAQSLMSLVFRDGVLKVFRNTLTNDLRFHCRVERESETYWMKASNAQLVPAYAYDHRLSNEVYIRDRESDMGSGYMGPSPGTGRPSGIYRFSALRELLDFQAKLTGEKVVLDIGSVRMVTLSKASSRSSIQFSSARLQIWHEAEGRRSNQSDVASFVTAGTALSGPLRERLVASSSRLMLYLGRSGGYITLFITDDIEIKADGPTLVKLKPRKGALPFSRRASRWPWIKARLQPNQGGSEYAGFDIHGRAVEVDVGSDYDSYKTFEIDFETSPSQDNFIRKWEEVMRERRLQRMKLNRIQEEMDGAVFTGRAARGLIT